MRSGTGGFPCLTSPSLYALGFISAVFCTSLEHRIHGSLCCSQTKHTVLCMVCVQSSPSTSTALMVCYTTQGCSAQQEQVIVARPPESQEVWGIGWFYPPPPLSEFHFWFALISFIVPIRISTTQAAERAFVSWSWLWVWEGRCWGSAVLQMPTPGSPLLHILPRMQLCSWAGRGAPGALTGAGRTGYDELGLCEAAGTAQHRLQGQLSAQAL